MTERPGQERHELVVGEPMSLSLAIDHGQFVAVDRGVNVDVDAYSPEATEIGLAAWSGGVAVFCGSHWTDETSVEVTLLHESPDVDVSKFDRVAIGGLECKTGEILVSAPEETGFRESVLRLPRGTYSLLVCGAGFDTSDDHGDDGADRYSLWLWPTAEVPGPRSLARARVASRSAPRGNGATSVE